MTFLLSFPMDISVNDQEDKDEKTNQTQDDNDRLVLPYLAHKLKEVRTHGFLTYTILSETKIAGALGLLLIGKDHRVEASSTNP